MPTKAKSTSGSSVGEGVVGEEGLAGSVGGDKEHDEHACLLAHPGPKTLARTRPSREAEIMPIPQNVPDTRHRIFPRVSVGRNSVTRAVVTGKLPDVRDA